MNRETTKNWPAADASLKGDCVERMPPLVFLCSTTTLPNPRAPRGFCRCPGSHQALQRIAADAWLLVPEGRRRKLAGGKPARAGAAPGCHATRTMPQRGIGEAIWVSRCKASPPPLVVSGRSNRRRSSGIPDHFFDAPLGHRATRDGFRGQRPLPRTCPRLISFGVPPGRQPCGDAGLAFQTRSVAAPPLCVHRASVGLAAVSTA